MMYFGSKALLRPILEYGNIIWSLHFWLDKRNLERVQCRMTQLTPLLSDKSYQHHLITLTYFCSFCMY